MFQRLGQMLRRRAGSIVRADSKVRAIIHRAAIETLENRQMLSTTVPAGYVKISGVNPIEIDSLTNDSSHKVNTGITLENGRHYFFKASDTHTLAPGRLADAQTYMTTTSASSWHLTAGPHLRVNGVTSWGAYQPDHVYGKEITGDGSTLLPWINDSHYSDNSGTLKLEVYEQVTLDSLTASDDSNSDRNETDADGGTHELTIQIDSGGSGAVSVSGLLSMTGTGIQAVYKITDDGGQTVSAGVVSASPFSVALTEGHFRLVAGIDLDGNSVLDADEPEKRVIDLFANKPNIQPGNAGLAGNVDPPLTFTLPVVGNPAPQTSNFQEFDATGVFQRAVMDHGTVKKVAGTGSANGITIATAQKAGGTTEFTVTANAALVVIGDRYTFDIFDVNNKNGVTHYIVVINII